MAHNRHARYSAEIARRRAIALKADAKRRVEAKAAADRHARAFTEMFSIDSPAEALAPSAEYLADLDIREQAEREAAELDSIRDRGIAYRRAMARS